MKIAIYEIVHLDWIIPLAELLGKTSYEISFFVHNSMKKDLETALAENVYNKYEWVYLKEGNILFHYRYLDEKIETNKYDIFWLNTSDSKHLVFAILKFKYSKMRLLVNIHAVNNFFKSKWSINIKRSLRHISKKILAKVTDTYLVNAERMSKYIKENKLTYKPCYTIAPVYYKEKNNNILNINTFTVVIPGSVDERRRDYKIALQAWKIFLRRKNLLAEARLILAGRITEYAKDIMNLYNIEETLKQTIVLYTKDIPECDFQQLMADASVILSPQVIETNTEDNIIEIYGITKNSGNSYDAIRHAKPFIVPDQLIIPEMLKLSTTRYTTAIDLANKLLDLFENTDHYKQQCQKAKESSEFFSYNATRDKIEKMLITISKIE